MDVRRLDDESIITQIAKGGTRHASDPRVFPFCLVVSFKEGPIPRKIGWPIFHEATSQRGQRGTFPWLSAGKLREQEGRAGISVGTTGGKRGMSPKGLAEGNNSVKSSRFQILRTRRYVRFPGTGRNRVGRTDATARSLNSVDESRTFFFFFSFNREKRLSFQ